MTQYFMTIEITLSYEMCPPVLGCGTLAVLQGGFRACDGFLWPVQ